jgi:hypothetical protein
MNENSILLSNGEVQSFEECDHETITLSEFNAETSRLRLANGSSCGYYPTLIMKLVLMNII